MPAKKPPFVPFKKGDGMEMMDADERRKRMNKGKLPGLDKMPKSKGKR